MLNSATQLDLETLETMVKLSKDPNQGDALERFLSIADTIHIIQEHTSSVRIRGLLEHASEHVDAINTVFRPVLDAAVGPLIGKLVPQAMKEIDEEILAHVKRREIMEQGSDHAKTYASLVMSGWKSDVSCEQWVKDEYERSLAKQAESYFIGRLEHKRDTLQTLFKKFVTNGETL